MQKLLKNLVPGLALAATLVTPSSASAGFSIFFSHGWQGHGHHGKRHHRHRNHDWYRYRRHYGHNGPWPWYKPYDNVYHPPHAHGPRHRELRRLREGGDPVRGTAISEDLGGDCSVAFLHHMDYTQTFGEALHNGIQLSLGRAQSHDSLGARPKVEQMSTIH